MTMEGRARLKASKAFLLLSCLLCLSCEGVIFHDFCPVGSEGWNRNDTLEFVFEKSIAEDTQAMLSLETRTKAIYPYKDIVVALEVVDTAGAVFRKDTLSCAVYDDTGRRTGSTAGIIYQQSCEPVEVSLPYYKSVLRITHLMPDTVLCGVTDVGIRIVAAD